MNLREFFEACKSHDWHWRRSEDSRADGPYRRGMRRETQLLAAAELSGGHRRCWRAWCDYVAGKRPRPEEFEFDFEDAI